MLQKSAEQPLASSGGVEELERPRNFGFRHPVDELAEDNLNRRSQMVEYRAYLSTQEEVKIGAEREEIRRLRMLQSRQYRGRTVEDAPPSTNHVSSSAMETTQD